MVSLSAVNNTHDVTAQTAITVNAQQQAMQTVSWMNAINDWLYDHTMDAGTVPGADLPVKPPRNGQNVVQGGRAYVWQPDAPGLLYQLEAASDTSALMGRVKNGRLTDAIGTDMGVSVPSSIPDGDIVYLN
ncbi:type IV pilus biogenesis protein PilM [Klebsiella aerogenes]